MSSRQESLQPGYQAVFNTLQELAQARDRYLDPRTVQHVGEFLNELWHLEILAPDQIIQTNDNTAILCWSPESRMDLIWRTENRVDIYASFRVFGFRSASIHKFDPSGNYPQTQLTVIGGFDELKGLLESWARSHL